jgi:hypothetical protein
VTNRHAPRRAHRPLVARRRRGSRRRSDPRRPPRALCRRGRTPVGLRLARGAAGRTSVGAPPVRAAARRTFVGRSPRGSPAAPPRSRSSPTAPRPPPRGTGTRSRAPAVASGPPPVTGHSAPRSGRTSASVHPQPIPIRPDLRRPRSRPPSSAGWRPVGEQPTLVELGEPSCARGPTTRLLEPTREGRTRASATAPSSSTAAATPPDVDRRLASGRSPRHGRGGRPPAPRRVICHPGGRP